MPPGSDEVIRQAVVANSWQTAVVSMVILVAVGAAIIWLKSTSKVAADSIIANANLVRQHFEASQAREASMAARITTLEKENRTTLLDMTTKVTTALADSSSAIKLMNSTLIELVRETRAQTGEIRKAAGEAHEALTESQIIKREATKKPFSTDIHDS